MKGKRLVAQMALIVVLLFTSAISPNMVQANYGAPEGWRDLPDYYIFKDTHGGGFSDSSGGLETENNNLPVDWDETYEDLPSLRFNVTEPVDWITSLNVMASWLTHDKSNYVPNGHLEFYVKGKEGGEQFMIGGDDNVARRDPVEQVVLVPVSDYVTVTTEWQHVKIPLKDIYDDPDVPLDAKNAWTIRLDIVNDEPFTVWINQLKMTSPDKEPGFPEIKVNQVGFRNLVEKYAYVSGFEDEFTADVGTTFQVRRVSDNTVAYSGELILAKDYDVDSGERVLKAVFTDLQESGDYYITVDAEGIESSLRFKIGDDVYHSLLFDAARYYLYQRSGMDLEEPFVPDYPRADITPMDTDAPFESDPSRTKDVSKGWFDAGDKGKYVSAGASSVTRLLWSYELFPDVYSDSQFNLPESGNGIPDILDESRWELEWVLNMQDEESGGFYAKVQSMNNNNDTRAIRDIRDGVGNLRPTNDTALAAAVLAHASLVYAEFDPDFAAQSLEAAEAGWVYLEQNPDNIKGPTDAYARDSDEESRLLAAATLYRVTGESKYHDYFLNNYEQSENVFVDTEGDWVGTYNYAFFQYMKSENVDEDALNWYKDHFTIWLDKSIDRYQTNAWNHTLNNGNFYWGSLDQILGTSAEAVIGSKLLEMYDETIHNMSLAALHYVLGANPLRKSFVTGHGEDSLQTVYAIMNDDPRPGIPSGFMPLGPNQYNNPGISNFPAKNFMDSATEWTLNEHTIHSTANLMFISAFANSDLTFLPPGGKIHLEADQAELSGGVKLNTNHEGYTGSGFLDGFWNYEGIATFTVNVPASGDYNVTARYGSAFHDPATMSLIVNGTRIKQTSFPILENWSTWGTQTETVTLNAGVNTIAYKYDDGDTGVINLDHIRVSPAPIEAETATLLGFASVYNDSSASGGQAVEYLHVEGNGIEFNNVPAANSLTVRYASVNSGTYSMYVNGVKTKTINFTGNGTWNGAYTSVTVPVDIPAGATLKLQHDAGDTGWNIDYIILQ